MNWATRLAWLCYMRRIEYRVDDFAAAAAYAEPLAQALDHLRQASGPQPKGLAATLWSDHPHAEYRIEPLLRDSEVRAS